MERDEEHRLVNAGEAPTTVEEFDDVEGALTGEELKSVRLRMGLSQAELGELIGLSAQRIGHLERGREGDGRPARISLTVELAVAAAALGVRSWDGRGRPRRVVGEIADED